jgi:hypothetical protein
MSSIGYLEVKVSKEKILKLKEDMDRANPSSKYGRYKAWLHYANLESAQASGMHFRYLTQSALLVADKFICTCGLYIEEGEALPDLFISAEIEDRSRELLLDPVQKVRGHRDLDEFKSASCALIVGSRYIQSKSCYLYSAYCQECGEIVFEKRNEEAKAFVNNHNQKHLGQL